MRIRDATERDVDDLTILAQRAKASWGYPESWLREWEDSLRFTPEYVRQHSLFVAEVERELVGVIALHEEPVPEIAHLWVLPGCQGQGIGKALLARAIQVARSKGWAALRIESDPNARAFYQRMGASCIGEVPAPVAGVERTLPVLRLPVAGEA